MNNSNLHTSMNNSNLHTSMNNSNLHTGINNSNSQKLLAKSATEYQKPYSG